jgi:hypothetical protein
MIKKFLIIQVIFVLLYVILYAEFKWNKKVGINVNDVTQPNVTIRQYIAKANLTPFATRYPGYNKCNVNYESANKNMEKTASYDYSLPADGSMHDQYIVRGILLYFPRSSGSHFMSEFKWLFRSWVETLKTAPKKWHTDLLVFIDMTNYEQHKVFKAFEQMGCLIEQPRQNKTAKSMCILFNYVSIVDRTVGTANEKNDEKLFEKLFNQVDVFSDANDNLDLFYANLKTLRSYAYIDSILSAFDGFKDYKNYDFVLRSDMDVFLTPLFGKWLPRHCNDFVVGKGAYSTEFNIDRLGRIATILGLNYANENNIGSTWYSTPQQIRIVSYLSLLNMIYLFKNEFTEPERASVLGALNWPDWHYGVLLLYGAHIAINHLWAEKQIGLVKLTAFFDHGTTSLESIDRIPHMHVFHGDDMFSKFQFEAGQYNNMVVTAEDRNKAKFYALYMALEGKRLKPAELKALRDQIA